MTRRTCAPSLVWFCTFQRKTSPTLMWTRSRSAASSWLCVPLPLPCTPMITYLRMSSAWHTQGGVGAPLGHRGRALGRRVKALAGRVEALAGIGDALGGLGGPGVAGRGPLRHGGGPAQPEPRPRPRPHRRWQVQVSGDAVRGGLVVHPPRSEEHTSELQ